MSIVLLIIGCLLFTVAILEEFKDDIVDLIFYSKVTKLITVGLIFIIASAIVEGFYGN